MNSADASEILISCRVPRGADFHRLDSTQVEALIERAKAWKYRQPKNANGSKARYFHAMLQRKASRLPT